jgi:hypothetical protein
VEQEWVAVWVAVWAEDLAVQQEDLAVETTHHLAGLQHLAHLRQEDSEHQPQPQVQQRFRQALVEIQALEAQRLDPQDHQLLQDLVENQDLHQQHSQQFKRKTK